MNEIILLITAHAIGELSSFILIIAYGKKPTFPLIWHSLFYAGIFYLIFQSPLIWLIAALSHYWIDWHIPKTASGDHTNDLIIDQAWHSLFLILFWGILCM